MSKVMKCNGQYVANDPCYPVCSLPDGSGCDYSGVFGGGSIGGPTDNYSITTGNAVTGNTSTRSVVSMIDPYQSITPSQMSSFDGSNRMSLDNDNGPTDLWFNAKGRGGFMFFDLDSPKTALRSDGPVPGFPTSYRYGHPSAPLSPPLSRQSDTDDEFNPNPPITPTSGRTRMNEGHHGEVYRNAEGCGKGFCGGGSGNPIDEIKPGRSSARFSHPDWERPRIK